MTQSYSQAAVTELLLHNGGQCLIFDAAGRHGRLRIQRLASQRAQHDNSR
jgi:hypothetical protein